MTAAEIVKVLNGRNGMARCPAHKDRNDLVMATSLTP